MKRIWQFALILLSVSMVPSAKALQAGTPEGALEEMAMADDVETVIKHLPVKVQEFMEKLPLPQRAAMAEKMLVSRNVEREGGSLVNPAMEGHGNWSKKKAGPKRRFAGKRLLSLATTHWSSWKSKKNTIPD